MQYFLDTAFVTLGGLLFWSGIEGLRHRVMWFNRFSARSGSFATVPTASLLTLGGLFFVAGVALLVLRKS